MSSVLSPYNKHYDPLVNKTPGHGVDYAPTYWMDSVGIIPKDDGTITDDITTDVAIIGSGFTGLCTALFLAKKYNIKATVIEANQLSWGCSSRNGGQAQLSAGRLARSEWIKKWGVQTAKNLHLEICDGLETFSSVIKNEKIQCDITQKGHLHIAHKPSVLLKLHEESKINNEVFNYKTKILDSDTLHHQYINERNSYGALLEPEGFGVQPAKLAFGYAKAARHYGAKIHTSSPVIGWQEKQGYNYLQTPNAVVKAKTVAVATGGYTHACLHKSLSYNYMPILSNAVVTRVLTKEEINACGLKTNMIITDTRVLRFYYRLLPDNRLQIGTRSAITGKHASKKKHYDLLINGMHNKFPALISVKIDYSWWGWVDVSHDMMPRIIKADKDKNIFYALGYGGNGVSFSAQAGKRMAQRISGNFDKKLNLLPIYNNSLPTHPFRPFRRIGQKLAYYYYHAIDSI